ncbi:ADP-ribosyl-[dinitrogen reductase] glycohydrolase [Gimesia maris]|uniref:ADP-ribosylglycohydrolase family protein n=1 Tax=Gimesia maris TaxID=122 RepID=UPI00118C0367|nr:ADP-ribosylglycohydrolase family protein [Gimesia maris]QDT80241.1 ADP-ribosyl-[dinitrogen reductase] glycohydrolase [Gimesia maris]
MKLPAKSIVLGTLLGGAVGDAMGAPFEGLWADSIPSADSLAASFHEYHGYPNGQFTDDTQLTLATIQSIVEQNDIVVADIARQIAELWRHHSVIGPGGACTQAAERYLATGDHRNMGAPVGQAGNGTAMRTAALGLWFDSDESLIRVVADVSRITHQDSRSVAGGVAIAMAAKLLSSASDINPYSFCRILADACHDINSEMADLLQLLPNHLNDEGALDFIAHAGQRTPEFENPIITPFVIPTVLASIYSILTCPDSWLEAVTFAVRLGGDVDTLGAIVGALAGARHGIDSIPQNLIDCLQDSRDIEVLATRYHLAIPAQDESGG